MQLLLHRAIRPVMLDVVRAKPPEILDAGYSYAKLPGDAGYWIPDILGRCICCK